MMNRRMFLTAAIIAFMIFLGLYMVREPLRHGVFLFLSPDRPIQAEVLVIEGWLSDCTLKEAAGEFLRGNYSYCLVSGGKNHSSHIPMKVLMHYGIDSVVIKVTEAETVMGHNTYYMALATRQWLQTYDPKVSTMNILTAGPHGRKSWMIFRRVFGQNYSIGVRSVSIEQCDDALWCGSNKGVRTLVKYGIGYIYAMLWPFKK